MSRIPQKHSTTTECMFCGHLSVYADQECKKCLKCGYIYEQYYVAPAHTVPKEEAGENNLDIVEPQVDFGIEHQDKWLNYLGYASSAVLIIAILYETYG